MPFKFSIGSHEVTPKKNIYLFLGIFQGYVRMDGNAAQTSLNGRLRFYNINNNNNSNNNDDNNDNNNDNNVEDDAWPR